MEKLMEMIELDLQRAIYLSSSLFYEKQALKKIKKLKKLMKEKNLDDVLLIGGGIIPKKDMENLEKMGTGKLFGPGPPNDETLNYIVQWVENNRR
mgnify:CR=1 FL=1